MQQLPPAIQHLPKDQRADALYELLKEIDYIGHERAVYLSSLYELGTWQAFLDTIMQMPDHFTKMHSERKKPSIYVLSDREGGKILSTEGQVGRLFSKDAVKNLRAWIRPWYRKENILIEPVWSYGRCIVIPGWLSYGGRSFPFDTDIPFQARSQ